MATSFGESSARKFLWSGRNLNSLNLKRFLPCILNRHSPMATEFAESSARQSKSGGQESNLLIQCIPDGIRQKLKSGNNPTNR
ncbi:MAG: hypothetical protein H0X49_16970 [Acidobacteria bacterium]|nr:hypothetical protein [Acidobacteriota bacterium]